MLKSVYELNIQDKPQIIFNVDETGFPINNILPKIVATQGARGMLLSSPASKGGENVTTVACCRVGSIFIPPFVIFKGKSIQAQFTSRIRSYSGQLNFPMMIFSANDFRISRSIVSQGNVYLFWTDLLLTSP
jgi:hypothetical protein